ncbi:MAG: ABC transporter ATP-binding protein/permease [Planctomycetes bacterium]|nr:ABC transporter ATP-binding protein/permease [Planctomycetota bacterium]
MKNFLRALKYSLAYRRRLIASLICAMMAAAFWGLNFTAVYPVLKILGNNLTLQEWVDQKIDATQKELAGHSDDLATKKERLKVVEGWGDGRPREREEHKVSGEIARVESKLDSSATRLWRYQQAKNYVIRHLPQDRFETFAFLMMLVVVGVAFKGIFEFFQEYLVGSVMCNTLYDIRNRFFRNAIHQDMRQFQENGSAEMMARFTNDMEVMGNGMKILYGRVIAEPLRAFACVAIACWISWQLTLMFLILVPAALYIMTKASRMMKRATRRVLERMSSIYKILQETFRGLRVVKAFTMEPYERRRFNRATKDYRDRSMRMVTIDAFAGPVVELFGVVAVSLAILAGAYLVLNQQTHLFGLQMCSTPIEPETLIQLYALLGGMADPVRKLSSVYTKLQSSAAAADRIFAYMDKTPQVQANSDGPRIQRHCESIEFRNICFSYQKGSTILENISLKVRARETIAIIGPNGCGKTTLLNLLPRFFDPDHGSIVIDGVDIRIAHLRSLRKQIGIVTQDAVIFEDTIRQNIAYGHHGASNEMIEAAARKAFAHEFIVTFPNGYDTMLGEIGRELSGGEKQRIALARAILRDPTILILDEFTSQIDPLSESLINEAMKEFKQGRTTFMITHKMHTLALADRIVVLNAGHIEAIGTHTELLGSSALYRELQEALLQRRAA